MRAIGVEPHDEGVPSPLKKLSRLLPVTLLPAFAAKGTCLLLFVVFDHSSLTYAAFTAKTRTLAA